MPVLSTFIPFLTLLSLALVVFHFNMPGAEAAYTFVAFPLQIIMIKREKL